MPQRHRKLTVLVVEDSDADLIWIREALGDHVTIIHAPSLAECHRSGEADLVLLDLNLADTVGADTVARLRAGMPHLPVVVLTHVDDPRVEADCIAAGAHAYYRKGQFSPGALIRSMESAVIAWSARLGDQIERSVHLATIDHILAVVTRIKERLDALDGADSAGDG